MMNAELHTVWGATKHCSVGRALPRAALVVDQETGDALLRIEQGLLQVVFPMVGPDWIQTSDLAVVDGDGFLS